VNIVSSTPRIEFNLASCRVAVLKQFLLEPSDNSEPFIVSGVAAVYNSFTARGHVRVSTITCMYDAYRAFLYLNYVLTIKSVGISQELSELIFMRPAMLGAQERKAREEIPREIARAFAKERAHSHSSLHL